MRYRRDEESQQRKRSGFGVWPHRPEYPGFGEYFVPESADENWHQSERQQMFRSWR